MAGPVLARRYAVPSALILGVETYDVRDNASVERQGITVDVLDRVLGGVIVGIALLIGCAAPDFDLLRRLDFVSAGVEVAGRDTRLGETVVIAAAVERHVLRRFTGSLDGVVKGAFYPG